MFDYPFLVNALIGVTIISVVAAVVGTYIMARRMVFISGGITHACFGGLGLGYWLGVSPMWMAALFAVGGSLGVDALARSRRVRTDSAIAVVWAAGMALGILFVFLKSGYVPDLNTFLFGNVLTITDSDLIMFGAFAVVVSLFFFLFRHVIVAVSFDEDFARTRKLPVRWVNLLMTVFVAVGIVMTIRLVGIMLLMSMLSLPQMSGECFSRRYLHIMSFSLLFALVGSLGGLLMAYHLDVPASATIVLLLMAIYLVSAGMRSLRRKMIMAKKTEEL